MHLEREYAISDHWMYQVRIWGRTTKCYSLPPGLGRECHRTEILKVCYINSDRLMERITPQNIPHETMEQTRPKTMEHATLDREKIIYHTRPWKNDPTMDHTTPDHGIYHTRPQNNYHSMDHANQAMEHTNTRPWNTQYQKTEHATPNHLTHTRP